MALHQPAAVAVQAGPFWLNNHLVTIYKNMQNLRVEGPSNRVGGRTDAPPTITNHLKPIESIDPAKSLILRNGLPAAGLAPIAERRLQALATVIAQAAAGNGSSTAALFENLTIGGQAYPGILTIRAFMNMTAQNQLAVIDAGWARVCFKKSYDKLTHQMFEPATTAVSGDSKAPVPSGVVPAGGGLMRVDYTGDSRLPDAFCGLGIGFRVDGSGDGHADSIRRVTTTGMTTQLKNGYLMRNIKGWEVEGTLVDRDTNAPRVWATKCDLFNESAVCVARNLYGATAFPTREMDNEVAVLWAVDVRGLRGFDTETYQMTLAGNKQWRPGEKAYKLVPKGNVIAHVLFNKRGCSGAGGWRFQIPGGSTWTYHGEWAKPAASGSREAKVRGYIESQLAAWSGPQHEIDGAYDFA
ncbi:hypothetical protein ACLF3G_14385 [Falsiroseomonas sp. HC035]|uniref:hypothetical protein n=1 Tax=Falsiroseomonas sp. HC035 TaxID=3390999 RepID=UPI003D31860B